jgi:hypothetical protein
MYLSLSVKITSAHHHRSLSAIIYPSQPQCHQEVLQSDVWVVLPDSDDILAIVCCRVTRQADGMVLR